MKVYIDSDFRCHMDNPGGTFREIETDFFDGKCDAFIEGYLFVPSGERWTRPDGVVFGGEMVYPWKDWRELDAAQREYERTLVAEYEAALTEIEAALGVTS